MENVDLEKLRGRQAGLILQETVKYSAVIIPIIRTDHGPEILFEVRSSRIGRQPGDICFPGGSMQEGETPAQAAVREACEELLIKPENIELIGPSDVYHNSSMIVYPFAAYISGYGGTYSKDEVAEVFTVPLEHFLTTEPFTVSSRLVRVDDGNFPYHLIKGGRDYRWPARVDNSLFYVIGDRTLWGISARIMSGFLKVLRDAEGTQTDREGAVKCL